VKNADAASQQRFHYFLLVVLLASLSGIAVFFVVTDQDIQVTVMDYRQLSSDEYFAELQEALHRKILMEFSPQICKNTALFFHNLAVGNDDIMLALDHETNGKRVKWTGTEREARARCLEHTPEPQMRRTCFVIQNNSASDSSKPNNESFLGANRALVEVQIQVRDQLRNRAIACDSLGEKPENDLSIVGYFSVYWLPKSKDTRYKNQIKLQKRNRGFLVAVPGRAPDQVTN